MAGGIFTAIKVEIQWFTGQWVDVSALVALEAGIKITQGRATEADDSSPGTCKFVLRNDDGSFTPNNPLSPYFPEVIENTPVRVSVVKGGVTYRRFTGFITSFEPSFPTDDGSTGVVDVTCVDVMAALARRLTNSEYMEQALRTAYYQQRGFIGGIPTWVDTFKLAGASQGAQTFPNLGVTIGTNTLGTLNLILAVDGSYSLSETDSDITLDGVVTFAPRVRYARGPVLRYRPQSPSALALVSFWFKVPQDTDPATTVPSAYFVLAQGYGPGNTLRWEVRLFKSSSTVTLGVYDPATTITTPMQTIDAYGALTDINSINDEQWHKVTIRDNFGTEFLMDDNGAVVAATANLTGCVQIYFGGSSAPSRERNTTRCGAYSIAGITAMNNASADPSSDFARPVVTTTDAANRLNELADMAPTLIGSTYRTVGVTASSTTIISPALFSANDIGDGIGVGDFVSGGSPTFSGFGRSTTITAVAGPSSATISTPYTGITRNRKAQIVPNTIGTENRTIARVNVATSGNLGEAYNTLARSMGGIIWVDQNGNLTLLFADALRPLTPLATLGVESDLEAGDLTLRRAVDTVPTRVTMSGPVGDVTYIDTASEALFARKEVTVDAGAGTAEDAYGLAGYYATRSRGLRVASASLDLVTAATDYYATFLTAGALHPGVRLRATGLPVPVFGANQTDVIVQGWAEEYDPETARFTFDLTPADDPVEGTFDNAEYGRWSADTSLALAYSITSAATTLVVVPTDNTGVTVTTSAGDFPLDLNVDGERVTVSSAPSTFTRTNLITNPSFEAGSTGWGGTPTGAVAATLSVSTDRAYDGLSSLLVTWGTSTAGNSGLQWNASVTSGQTYTFSLWVWVPAGGPRVRVAELFASGTSVSYTRQDTTGWEDGWVQLGMTLTATATTTYFFGLRNVDATVAGQVVYVDAALWENTTRGIGAFFDGDSNGGSWTGTANASTSTQSAQLFTVTRAVSPTTTAIAHDPGGVVDIYHSMAFTN